VLYWFSRIVSPEKGAAGLICGQPRGPFVGAFKNLNQFNLLTYLLQEAKGLSLAGFVSWFVWRSAYLTRVISWRNRFYVAINWATTFVFGRDISRI
jgi:NADH:ubiquinone reductase (non-electrogenic)